MRKLIYISLSFIMLLGCSNNVDEQLLIGKYNFSTYKSDIIDVNNNHTYEHRYITANGKIFKSHGKWRYNGKEILFHDFNFFNDSGPAGGSGIWISRVVEDSGKVHLIYSSENGIYFEKE